MCEVKNQEGSEVLLSMEVQNTRRLWLSKVVAWGDICIWSLRSIVLLTQNLPVTCKSVVVSAVSGL